MMTVAGTGLGCSVYALQGHHATTFEGWKLDFDKQDHGNRTYQSVMLTTINFDQHNKSLKPFKDQVVSYLKEKNWIHVMTVDAGHGGNLYLFAKAYKTVSELPAASKDVGKAKVNVTRRRIKRATSS